MNQWNKKSIIKLHQMHQGGFAGDVVSAEVVRFSKKYIGKKVLDVGAGSGALIKLLPGAVGIDLVPKDPRILQADISHLPFERNTFDTVFGTEVLEHLDEETLTKGLREIHRVMRHGSYAIFTVPYRENLEQNMDVCPKCGERFHRWGHFRSFNEESLRSYLENNGFIIITIKPIPLGLMAKYHILRHAGWFLRRFLHKLGYVKLMNLFVIAKKQ